MKRKDDNMDVHTFWKIRSADYDKLFWVRDQDYLAEIIRLADLHSSHITLDVGTGTGAVATAIKDHVRHAVAIDISGPMLQNGDWTGVSVVKWDIGEVLFSQEIFHRVFARMVFHHILDNLDRAILRCYDLLKEGGKIIVSEGVPPIDYPDVVDWFTKMFALKEERRTFTPDMLVNFLEKNGFKEVESHTYYMDNFSIANWVENSGLEKGRQQEILDMHRFAPDRIKEAYNMRISEDDCIVRTKNMILVGSK